MRQSQVGTNWVFKEFLGEKKKKKRKGRKREGKKANNRNPRKTSPTSPFGFNQPFHHSSSAS